jgi:hypothetical protein
MNRLPAVLQNEIWEYVHGDRAHFKLCHRACMVELHGLPARGRNVKSCVTQEQLRMSKRQWCDRFFACLRIGMDKTQGVEWEVTIYNFIAARTTYSKEFERFEDARREYHKQITICAMEAAKDPTCRL